MRPTMDTGGVGAPGVTRWGSADGSQVWTGAGRAGAALSAQGARSGTGGEAQAPAWRRRVMSVVLEYRVVTADLDTRAVGGSGVGGSGKVRTTGVGAGL